MKSDSRIQAAQAALEQAWMDFAVPWSRLNELDYPLGHRGLAFYQKQHPLWTPAMQAALPPAIEVMTTPDKPWCFFEMMFPDGDLTLHVVSATERGTGHDVLLGWLENRDQPESSEMGVYSLIELRKVRGAYLLNVETVRGTDPHELEIPDGIHLQQWRSLSEQRKIMGVES